MYFDVIFIKSVVLVEYCRDTELESSDFPSLVIGVLEIENTAGDEYR